MTFISVKAYRNFIINIAALLMLIAIPQMGYAVRILVDMDGVIANFEAATLRDYQKEYPDDKNFIPLEERTEFLVGLDYEKRFGPDYKKRIDKIHNSADFFRSLPIIEGAKEALKDMVDKKYEVFLVTSPLQRYENCVKEKYDWVKENLGPEWTNRIVMTRDKTIVRGDVLIDDKPNITGLDPAPWRHILFNQPYNAKENKPRITHWKEWESVVNSVLEPKKLEVEVH
jgi:5'-nucleotidase